MPHAIIVRRPSDYFDPDPKALALDLPGLDAAQKLAKRLAYSYPCHGRRAATGVFWFRDQDGLVEIWPQVQS